MAENCEAVQRYLDDVIGEAREAETKGAYLIIIIRLRDGERANLYETRRKELEAYFKRYAVKYVVARGRRVKEDGRADFYVAGKLFFGLGIKKNSKRVCEG